MHSVMLHTTVFGRTLRNVLFGAQAGQRWLFRRNRGWLGGDRLTDRSVLWICCAFALLGLALLTNQEAGFLSPTAPAWWPATSARIVSLRIDEKLSGRGVHWTPQVIYRYSVAGRQYQSSRVSITPLHWTSREEANSFLARYVGHTEVSAYYNPRQPDQALLEKQDTRVDTATFVGALLIVLGLATLVIYVQLR